MGKKLSHLPTKPTPVTPETGKPFVRRQHVNPNKDEPEANTSAKEQIEKDDKSTKGVDKSKKKLAAIRSNIEEQKVNPRQKELEAGYVKHDNKLLDEIEQDYFSKIPERVKPSHLEMIYGGNINAVYIYGKGTDSESFYKPRKGEDHELRAGVINDNFAGREVLAYELSKMLGAEDLMPPTKMQQPDFEGSGKKPESEGSMQMSIYKFGKKLGLSNVETAYVKASSAALKEKAKKQTDEVAKANSEDPWGEEPQTDEVTMDKSVMENFYKLQMDKIENAGDLVAFDFIINNTDRHGFNFFVGEKENGNLQAIAYDHGSAFPERDSNEFYIEDKSLTKDTQRNICRSAQASTAISTKFMIGILEFNEGDFDKLRKAYGLSDEAAKGVVTRIKALQEYVKEKFAKAQQTQSPEEFESMDKYKAYMRKQGTLTAYDVSKAAERKFGVIFG